MPFPIRNRRVNHWINTGNVVCFWNTVNIIEITTLGAGSYTKPGNLYALEVIAIGGGGAGGSGRKQAASGNRTGGGGGSSGQIARGLFLASSLSPTENYYVGAGGIGGASATVDNSGGNAGTAGENTTFGSLVLANRGLGGSGGVNGTSAAGGLGFLHSDAVPANSFVNSFPTANAGNGTQTTGGNVSYTGSVINNWYKMFGGSGGGGLNTANTAANGGATPRMHDNNGVFITVPGIALGNTGTHGGDGTNNVLTNLSMSSSLTFSIGYGSPAGGGGAVYLNTPTINAGNGGNGGLYGGGGGGGGASTNTVAGGNSGKGGAGGQGCLILVEYLQ